MIAVPVGSRKMQFSEFDISADVAQAWSGAQKVECTRAESKNAAVSFKVGLRARDRAGTKLLAGRFIIAESPTTAQFST
jgi:hypothetical protein